MAVTPLGAGWSNPHSVTQGQYVCGHCSTLVGPNQGYKTNADNTRILICPLCNRPIWKAQANTLGLHMATT